MISVILVTNLLLAIWCFILLNKTEIKITKIKSFLIVFLVANVPVLNIILLAFLLLN